MNGKELKSIGFKNVKGNYTLEIGEILLRAYENNDGKYVVKIFGISSFQFNNLYQLQKLIETLKYNLI